MHSIVIKGNNTVFIDFKGAETRSQKEVITMWYERGVSQHSDGNHFSIWTYQINKLHSKKPTQYYVNYVSILKKSKLLILATTWMNLKSMLNERSKTQKTTYCIVPFIWISRKGKSIETRKQICGYLGLGARTKCTWTLGNFGDDETLYNYIMAA